jgi:hypothetical protein
MGHLGSPISGVSKSLAQRASLRSNAYSADVWPPKGCGPENIPEAVSVIAVPEGE